MTESMNSTRTKLASPRHAFAQEAAPEFVSRAMFDELVAVQAFEGKGLGLVASQAIPTGQRILSEAPFLVVRKNEYAAWEDQLDQFRKGGDIPKGYENHLQAKLEEKNQRERDMFWALCDSHTPGRKSACGVLLSNSLSMGTYLQDSGLLALGSRFNHSCTPNVCYSWQEELDTYFFHAAREVEPGEELTISYVSPFRPSSMRLDALALQFKFRCACPCCSLDSRALQASDERRRKMLMLDRGIGSLLETSPSEQQVAPALHAVSMLAALIDEELGGNPKLKARAYYGGFQIALAAECAEEAGEMLEKMQEQAILTVGADGDVGACLGVVCANDEEDAPEVDHCVPGSEATLHDGRMVASPCHASQRAPVADLDNCRASELKKRYRRSHRAEGGSLDVQGLQDLLRQGRPDISEKEVLVLFDLMQKGPDGKIEFDELVDFLYSASESNNSKVRCEG